MARMAATTMSTVRHRLLSMGRPPGGVPGEDAVRSRTPCAGITQIRYRGSAAEAALSALCAPLSDLYLCLQGSISTWSYHWVTTAGSLSPMTTTDATNVPAGANVDEKQARQVAEAAREAEWRKPSFGKELFLGRLRMDLIDPWPAPEPAAVAKAEEFLAKLGDFAATIDGARIEREARIPDEVFHGLAGLGAFGMKIDEKYGGLGLTNLHYCKALALVGSANPALGALLSAHQSIGVPQPLKLFGTAGQKEKYLPRLAGGEVSAFLLTEADVGSDPARLATTATPVDGGDRPAGVKTWGTHRPQPTPLGGDAHAAESGRRPGRVTAFVAQGGPPRV